MAKWPFACGCMEWAEPPWVGAVWINKELHGGDWELHENGSLLGGGEGRALGRAQTARKWDKSCLGAQGAREEWGEALCVLIKASAGDGELLQTRV